MCAYGASLRIHIDSASLTEIIKLIRNEANPIVPTTPRRGDLIATNRITRRTMKLNASDTKATVTNHPNPPSA